MARIPYADPASLPEDIRERLGPNPPNVSRMLAGASAAVNRGYGAFGRALINESPLPAALREIAILRVGYLSNARYEVFQHEALARHVGLSDAELEAVRKGGDAATRLGAAGAAVLAFTDDVVRNVKAGDATLAAVRSHLPDEQVIDLIFAIGAYMMVSRFLETTGVDLDEKAIDWAQTGQGGAPAR